MILVALAYLGLGILIGEITLKNKDRQDRRKSDITDAEGTTRLPEVQKALDAGRLNSPPADEPRGNWNGTYHDQ